MNYLNTKVVAIVLVLLFAGAAAYAYSNGTLTLSGNPIACTQEAKICPDGSAVGRTGPNCEFAACPTSPATGGCTREAKVCPDGSNVYRAGPSCVFAACPTGVISPEASFSASPTSGNDPLTVNFQSVLTDPSRYTINFGNGTSGKYQICAESNPYQCSLQQVYRSVGTYVAQLIYSGCPANAVGCLAPDSIVKSLNIVVR